MKREDTLVAIAFSDIHFHKFRVRDENGSRLRYSIKAFKEIAREAYNNMVPLLFCGDLFHTPKEVENDTLGLVMNAFTNYIEDKRVQFIGISGNHDLSQKSGIHNTSPSYIQTFARALNFVHCLDRFDDPFVPVNKDQDTAAFIWGVPYMNSEKELRERIKQLKPIAKKYDGFKILMLHNDCAGALENSGMRLGDTDLCKKSKLDKFFKEWDLVLFGHIHLPQQLSKKCYMLGSPIHQISSDRVEMGYWKIFNDRPPKFYGLVNYPKFIELEKGQEPWNERDYFIPFEEKAEIEEIEKGEFTLDHSRTNLAKKYLKKKGIKNKAKKRALIQVLNSVE